MTPIQIPELALGEIYVGGLIGVDGQAYHLILLPDDNADALWEEQMAWAMRIGGDLPNRIELAMLYKKQRSQLQESWYWGNEHNDEWGPSWAPYLDVFSGGTYFTLKEPEFRARAVRRVPL